MANAKKKCKHCKDYFSAGSMVKPPAGTFCTIEHAMLFAKDKQEKDKKKLLAKAKRDKKAVEKKNRKALLELNRKNLSWQHNQTRPVFNKMRRLEELKWYRDRGLEPVCISCGKPKMDWCAGHYKSSGSNARLRYDPKNVYLQCNMYCNKSLSANIDGHGNTRGYKQGLIDRFGDEKGQEILDYCESNNAPKKYTCDELEQMRAKFNARIRELEQFDN